MKTLILFLFIALASCSKDSPSKDMVFELPPETQVGANTFGVTINGKVYVPRDPTGVNVGGATPKGMRFWRSPDNEHIYDELIIVDGASTVGFKITLHIQNLFLNGIGQYSLSQSNFQNGIDSDSTTNIFFKIYDYEINNYTYYGSIENDGFIYVTRYDFENKIFSAKFSGKFVRYDNPNKFIQINDGRLDINWGTLEMKQFP